MTDAVTRAAEVLKDHGSNTHRLWGNSKPNTTFPRPIPTAKRIRSRG